MSKKLTLIQSFVFLGNFGIPLYALILFLFKQRDFSGFLMFAFVTVCLVERAWETFKTSKERKRDQMHGDWTLALVTGTYLLLFFLFITEFYFFVKSYNLLYCLLGSFLLAASFRLRWWGMKALGSQWAVHAVGVQKIKRVRLIKLGPFKYIRHPIYLGIILEELSFPIIAGTPWSLLFALLICVPLVVIRAKVEEKSSERRFGVEYEKYKQQVGMLFPSQLFKSKPH